MGVQRAALNRGNFLSAEHYQSCHWRVVIVLLPGRELEPPWTVFEVAGGAAFTGERVAAVPPISARVQAPASTERVGKERMVCSIRRLVITFLR